MLKIINYGTIRTLTRELNKEGFDLKSMNYLDEYNEIILIYDNRYTTYMYTWRITIRANVQEEENGTPNIIDIIKVDIENIGELI